MEIRLKTTKSKRFRVLIELYGIIPPWSRLRKREKDVLAALYELNYNYSNLPIEQREMLIFHKDNRKGIAESIGISSDSFNNILADLKKKGLLLEKKFVEKYIITNSDSVTFKLVDKEI